MASRVVRLRTWLSRTAALCLIVMMLGPAASCAYLRWASPAAAIQAYVATLGVQHGSRMHRVHRMSMTISESRFGLSWESDYPSGFHLNEYESARPHVSGHFAVALIIAHRGMAASTYFMPEGGPRMNDYLTRWLAAIRLPVGIVVVRDRVSSNRVAAISAPSWLSLMTLFAMSSFLLWVVLRYDIAQFCRNRTGACPKCGYPRCGTASTSCPECGARLQGGFKSEGHETVSDTVYRNGV